MTYGYTKQINLPFAEALEKVRGALAEEGFGIPSEMDVRAVLQKKLGKDIGGYYILGACHPASAYKAIQAEKEIGLLLPCNVLVYERDGAVFASAILPRTAMQMVDNPAVGEVAREVEQMLKRALDRF